MKIVCAGEVMVEFVSDGNVWQQAYGGDTYNTAIYLARAGLTVDYLTWLGDDNFSRDIVARLQAEAVGTERIVRKEATQPGLYTIHNKAGGEREFSYWRQSSPVREMFNAPLQLSPAPDLFYFSGITLAVTRSGLSNLLRLLAELRAQGCKIVFDPNYRPKLWDSVEQTQRCYEQVLPYCDTVMPTLDDEALLWNVTTIEQCFSFYSRFNVGELVIKADGPSCHVFVGDDVYQQTATPREAVDTTGAGDSFNAGYLASRCLGGSVMDAISSAQALAAEVVMHRGAVLPR